MNEGSAGDAALRATFAIVTVEPIKSRFRTWSAAVSATPSTSGTSRWDNCFSLAFIAHLLAFEIQLPPDT